MYDIGIKLYALVNFPLSISSSLSSLHQAHKLGRVDAFIQSTDKNLMVPVGGAVVASSSELFVKEVAQIYPGQHCLKITCFYLCELLLQAISIHKDASLYACNVIGYTV